MINITKYEFEQMKKFEEETLTDYEIKQINEEEFYIHEDMIMCMISDLLVHYHRALEQVEELEEDIRQHYTLKPESREAE